MALSRCAFLWFAVSSLSVFDGAGGEGGRGKVLLISFDGFRYDYLNRTSTPNFDRFTVVGSRAKWVQDAFISKTFPNHFAIVTGLYEESHGIVSNSFFDPKLNETFKMSSTESKWWSVGAEPIWVTNQNQCSRCKSGVFFWPGSEAVIEGVRPSYYKLYNQSVPFEERADQVVRWLSEDDVTLALLYYHEPDHTAHICGPESSNVTQKIRVIDGFFGYLLDKLDAAGLTDVDVLATADHGFATLTQENPPVVLESLLMGIPFEALGSSPALSIWPSPKDDQKAAEKIYEQLHGTTNISVYRREEIPSHYHYSKNDRIAPIFVVADVGYGVYRTKKDAEYYKANRRGDHGYDNRLMDMHPFFVARGPSFRRGFVAEPFDIVDVYPLLCYLLRLQPAFNNGSLANVCPILAAGCDDPLLIRVVVIVFILIIVVFAAGFTFIACRRRSSFRPSLIPLDPVSIATSDLQLRSPDVDWDDDVGDDVHLSMGGKTRGDSSSFRGWSRAWRRKWSFLRESRRWRGSRFDEGDSLLHYTDVVFTPNAESQNNALPSHLADMMK